MLTERAALREQRAQREEERLRAMGRRKVQLLEREGRGGALGTLPAQSGGAPPQREHPAADVQAEQPQHRRTRASSWRSTLFVKIARAARTMKEREVRYMQWRGGASYYTFCT
jgi:hypothetical protein